MIRAYHDVVLRFEFGVAKRANPRGCCRAQDKSRSLSFNSGWQIVQNFSGTPCSLQYGPYSLVSAVLRRAHLGTRSGRRAATATKAMTRATEVTKNTKN